MFNPRLDFFLCKNWYEIRPTASPSFQAKNCLVGGSGIWVLCPLVWISNLYLLFHFKPRGTIQLISGPTHLSLKTIDLFKLLNDLIRFSGFSFFDGISNSDLP